MNEIKFENGSVIKPVNVESETIRSRKSELMSFYCYECQYTHEDYPIKNIRWIFDDEYSLCKESYDKYCEVEGK